MSKYGIAILVMVLGGWLVRLLNLFIAGSARSLLVTIAIAFVLFAFGISLQHKRNNKTWVKKLLVAFVFLFFLLCDLGYLRIGVINNILDALAIDGFVIYLVYIYCGWLFFD